MAEERQQDRPSRQIQDADLPAWDSAKDTVATGPLYVPGLHHHRPGEESQSLSEEMVRPTAE